MPVVVLFLGGFQRLGFAAPQLVGEIAAALFTAPDYADLITEHVGFGDVLDFGHTAISNGFQLAVHTLLGQWIGVRSSHWLEVPAFWEVYAQKPGRNISMNT